MIKPNYIYILTKIHDRTIPTNFSFSQTRIVATHLYKYWFPDLVLLGTPSTFFAICSPTPIHAQTSYCHGKISGAQCRTVRTNMQSCKT